MMPVAVSEDTFYVIQESLRYSEIGSGRFDISVQPLVDLWGIGTEKARIPDPDEIESTLAFIDYKAILLEDEDRSIFLKNEGMAVDLGGIAKGYAADKAKDFLLERGFTRGIVNFGGNVIAFGIKPNKDPWKIGIQDPFESRNIQIGVIDTPENSIVTSGIYERFFEKNGTTYHHILDTSTGFPVDNNVASVTIVTELCIAADAYSTLVFSLGLDEGLELIESISGLEGIFVTKEREIFISSGLYDSFTLKNSKYNLQTR
jgi:thiamine biosynthesis lipoprotein